MGKVTLSLRTVRSQSYATRATVLNQSLCGIKIMCHPRLITPSCHHHQRSAPVGVRDVVLLRVLGLSCAAARRLRRQGEVVWLLLDATRRLNLTKQVYSVRDVSVCGILWEGEGARV